MWAIGGRIAARSSVLLIVSIVLFVLVHTIPVSPARVVLGIDASEADIAEFDRDHGLDRPLWQQYRGVDRRRRAAAISASRVIDDTSISRQIADTFPVTLRAGSARIPVRARGRDPARRALGAARGPRDRSPRTHRSVVGVSIPGFWLGLMLIAWGAVELGWFPAGGYVPWRAGALAASAIARAAGDCARALLCGDHQPHDALSPSPTC